MMGIEVSNESLSYSILLVEQLLTTGSSCIGGHLNKTDAIMAPGSESNAVKELTRIIEPYFYGNLI